MGETPRKSNVAINLVVGKRYGDAGVYRGHGTAVLVDPDSTIGGVQKYYVFEPEGGGKRKRLNAGDVLNLLRKLENNPPL